MVDRILARSEGNAFFAEELVAAGAIRADIALPDALADVLLGRIEALGAGPGDPQGGRRPAAGSATAAGRGAGRPRPRSSRACATPSPGRCWWPAATESYRFRHALLQEAVYGDLLPGERTRLHATYARLLAAPTPTARTARPRRSRAGLALPGQPRPAGGLAALVRAADHAATVFAPSEAFRHLTQALELWNRVPEAAAVAGVDRVEVLVGGRGGQPLRRVPAGRRPGQEAVEAIDEDAEPLRAAMAYERLSSYLLDASWSSRIEEMLAASAGGRAGPRAPPTPLRARVAAGWPAR